MGLEQGLKLKSPKARLSETSWPGGIGGKQERMAHLGGNHFSALPECGHRGVWAQGGQAFQFFKRS